MIFYPYPHITILLYTINNGFIVMIKDLLLMTRPFNSFMTGLGVLFAVLVYTNYSLPPIHVLLIGFLTGFLGSASSMLINDYIDRFVDAVNKPWKPIPSGRVKPSSVFWSSLIVMTLAIIINIPIGFTALIIASIYVIVGYMYSFLRRYWWSHFIVSFSTTGPIVYGYVVAGAPASLLGLMACFSLTIFFINSGREILKAIMDVEGDKKYGYITIPIRYGVGRARLLMIMMGLVGSVLGIATGIAGYAGAYYLVLITIAAIVYMYALIKAYRYIGRREILEKSRKHTIRAMLLGLIAFLLSRF